MEFDAPSRLSREFTTMPSRTRFLLLLVFSLATPSLTLAPCPHQQPGIEFGRWSQAETWGEDGIPEDGSDLLITFPVLLDCETARLAGVRVKGENGRLVFDPEAELAKLVSDQVVVEAGGRIEVGSEDCRFEGKAEILLTGMRNDNNVDPVFDAQKFLGVGPDGTLEIHGPEKLSWTKLTATLKANGPKNYDTATAGQPEDDSGFVLYEFRAGDLERKVEAIKEADEVADAIRTSSPDSIIFLTKQRKLENKYFKKIDEFEAAAASALGLTADDLNLDKLTDKGEAWAILVDLADVIGSLREGYEVISGPDDPDGTSTGTLVLSSGGFTYRGGTTTNPTFVGGVTNEVTVESFPDSYLVREVGVADSAYGWEAGDEVFVASTDYDMLQAEVFTVREVIDGTRLVLEGEVKYTHWGDFYETIDMRAEVGLLTRSNIRIRGEMSDSCYESSVAPNLCSKYDRKVDNFGGHTKAIKGFRSYRIEGAELFHLGQTAKLGSYPVHFHMAEDTKNKEDGSRMYIRQNAIHHTFSRCVTIHGSFDVDVVDNVAFDHFGHCYFEEDGAEKGIVFDHNLGAVTRRSFLTDGDREGASTFWITSPLTTITNNAAAGSDNAGYWLIYPDLAVADGANLHVWSWEEARNTMMSPFVDNSAHSSRQGLAFFRKMIHGEHKGEVLDHGIGACKTYNPHQDPLDLESPWVPLYMERFTGFKNSLRNVVMRAAYTYVRQYKLADSLLGVQFVSGYDNGFQVMEDSVVVGESPNLGAGNWVTYEDPETGEEVTKWSERSVPIPTEPWLEMIGVENKQLSPLHIRDVKMYDFLHHPYRKAAAYAWKDELDLQTSPTSTVERVSFNYADPAEGYYVMERNHESNIGEVGKMLRDVDGSVTGVPGSTVLDLGEKTFSKDLDCDVRKDWALKVCPGFFGKIAMTPETEVLDTFVTYTDGTVYAEEQDMAAAYTTQFTTKIRVWYNFEPDTADLVVHWHELVQEQFSLKVLGLDTDQSVVLGVCLPRGILEATNGKIWKIIKGDDVIVVDTMEELQAGEGNYFYDEETSILYKRIYEIHVREDDNEGSCTAGMDMYKDCPQIRINMGKYADSVDLGDGDCSGRL